MAYIELVRHHPRHCRLRLITALEHERHKECYRNNFHIWLGLSVGLRRCDKSYIARRLSHLGCSTAAAGNRSLITIVFVK